MNSLKQSTNGSIVDHKWSINGSLEGFMFNKTLNFSDLKSDPSLVSEMNETDVYQIFHRGHDVKVMMTQEHYFTLMARLEKAEGVVNRTSFNPEKLMADFESKVEKLNSLIGKVELKNKQAV